MNNYNAEIRFPFLGPLYGAAFWDAGNVWETSSDWEPGDLYYGTGMGIRIKSPVGPVRLDFGYPINPSADMENNEFHFYLSIGEAF